MPEKIGHNIEKFDDKVMEILTQYSESLERSSVENDIRKELRDKGEEIGLTSKGLQDGLARIKASMKVREGYDETMQVIERIAKDMGGADSIFAWVVKKEAEKAAEREAKLKERQQQAEKSDSYKPAAERKPKPASTKGAAEAAKEIHDKEDAAKSKTVN